jgi:hypothetical protein
MLRQYMFKYLYVIHNNHINQLIPSNNVVWILLAKNYINNNNKQTIFVLQKGRNYELLTKFFFLHDTY